MFNDTASYISNVYARPSVGQQTALLNEKDNRLFEGIVVGIGPLENLENTILVRVMGINETFKVEASMGNAVSASTSTGEFTPYFKGDRVLCCFLNGQQRMTIVARINNTNGVSEYIQQDGFPVPSNGELNPSGERMQPNPLTVTPETASDSYFSSIKVYPRI